MDADDRAILARAAVLACATLAAAAVAGLAGRVLLFMAGVG